MSCKSVGGWKKPLVALLASAATTLTMVSPANADEIPRDFNAEIRDGADGLIYGLSANNYQGAN
ncbi:hypothetical protein [Streptomyces lavendofoliae]|uniref:hypothetical protein n=1 Tax=Streptomyces lavendofoliae TaxID=67314 RepID=UPI00300F0428